MKKFVSTSDLFNDDVRALIDRLMEQEAYMTTPSLVKGLLQYKDRLEDLSTALGPIEKIFAPMKEAEIFKTFQEDPALTEIYTKKLSENKELLQDLMFRIKGEIDKKLVKRHEEKLLTIDKEIEKIAHHGLLVPSTLFVCSRCNVILFSQEIDNKKCLSCNSEISQENMKRISVYKVPDEIKNIWRSNLWFEAYFAGLLRKLGFRTWVSVHAMGASGILHEVDVLAIKNGTVIVCECKTGKISRNDVFNFCTKVGDLKTHMSILALIRELPEPQTREFVRKNRAIITLENMGRMKEDDVLTDLKRKLSQ